MNFNYKAIIYLILVIVLFVFAYNSFKSVLINIGEPLPVGSAFNGSEQMPVKEFKEKYQIGLQLLNHLKEDIHRYRVLSSVSEWITFILTSVITIFIGIQGKILQPTNNLTGLDKVITLDSEKYASTNKWLMIIAALCSVLIAFNGICKSKLEMSVKDATNLSSALYKSRSEWFDAKSQEQAASALKQLDEYLISNQ